MVEKSWKGDTSTGATKPMASLNLEKLIIFKLTVLSNSLSSSAMRLYGRKYGLRSATEWPIIAALGHQAPLTVMDIVNFTKFEKTRVARAVQRLISVGLIVTQKDLNDGRQVLLWLSREGANLHDKTVPHTMRRNEIISSNLSDGEKHQLEVLLNKLELELPSLDDYSDNEEP